MEMTSVNNINKILKCFKDEPYIKEFEYDYNIIELGCLKEIIGEYVKKNQNQKSFIVYKSKNEKNKYFTYLLTEIDDGNQYLLANLTAKLKELIKKYVCVFIEIDIKYLKKVRLKVFIKNKISEDDENELKKYIDFFYNKISKDLEDIILAVKDKYSSPRGLITYVGIKKNEAIGFYKSKYFEFDAGKENEYFSVNGKKIKMKYKFNEYYLNTGFDNIQHRIEFSSLLSSTLSVLFQMLTKTPFADISKMEYFGENQDVSSFNKTNMFVDIENTQFREYMHIPTNIDKLIDNFFIFEPLKQNCFYRSCKSFINALNSSGIKSLFYSYQAIENMVTYYESINEYPLSQRSNNIKSLLIKYYDKSFPDDAQKFWDIYRNKYAHNGIEENELIELAIGEHFNSFNPIELDELFNDIVHKTLINILEDV